MAEQCVNPKVKIANSLSTEEVMGQGFQIPAKPDPTHPVPPLIGNGTPVGLYALIRSNDEPAEGPPSLFELHWAGVYIKFW